MIIEETRNNRDFHRNGHRPVPGTLARASSSGGEHINISFEFFPPKTEKMGETLWQSIQKLESLNPDFVSVTYGAGGSTRERTHQTVARIVKESSLKAAAHLTCVGSDKAEIDEIAREYWQAGVRHIVALRGDPVGGLGAPYVPVDNGYAYASDLVTGLKNVADFEISVSAYPELHPESLNWDDELDNLKRKIDAGATRAITQFFFSADTFMRYLDKALDAGISIPIIPGLMLQPNYRGLTRIAKLCYISIPDWYHNLFEPLDDDPQTRLLLTASTAADLAAQLRAHGVDHFHFYTLNKADLAFTTCQILGVKAQNTIAQKVVT
ncbi:MAG: methylenetetrahydrofolate reductase [NAD(P)H] [Robiginitomaculum sp.]|nr:MAG: methylenetetrahydrofolate reductase [NAD(P)H] [Robiginitomaculum sp.]